MDPFQTPVIAQDLSMSIQSSPKTQRNPPLPENALAILKKFFSEVSHSPTAAQKDELVARVKVQGCEWWNREQCTNWFSRQRKRHATSNPSNGPEAAVATSDGTIAGEDIVWLSSRSHKRKKTAGDILYPSLNKKAIKQLEVLIADTPHPIPEIIEIWADRLGATAIDVTTWIKLQRAKAPVSQPLNVAGSGSVPRDADMTAGPSHLPTPAKSTSPETELYYHHHHQENNGSNTPSPVLSGSSTHFPMSVSGTTAQFSHPEAGIKEESALCSPFTPRFPHVHPPVPPPPPQAMLTVDPIPSDAASVSSASVVSRMMRNAADESPSVPARFPSTTSRPQNGWLHGHSPSSDIVMGKTAGAHHSSPSPIRISGEVKLGLSAMPTFKPGTVTVTSISDDSNYPKTVAEFNERFAKYEHIIVDFLEKVDTGSLRSFGFEPGPTDPA